jgi:serine/threonine protein phosphatase PrpC
LLLCSDGLWSQTPEPQLAALFDGKPDSLESRLQQLVQQAAGATASDNVTAVALTWLGQPAAATGDN